MMKRKGSALLIVLGMLAFMVVSAVSFSMFMRQSRVPSSYLRRTASSRYLLKAALANAIARIDGQLATEAQIGNPNEFGDNPSTERGFCEGIYDDPYPGIGPSQVNDNDADHRKNGGYFERRVFCPFGLLLPSNEQSPANTPGTVNRSDWEDSNGVPHYQTVSTLTLEGLAYLPPAIINEVRVYSRLTRTAKWRNLAYDAGRYAFCAVDVSDCFDINRMSAGERRSSAPGERVNLSSLFSNNYGTQLDDILKQCSNFWTPGGNNIPFTSVADFNIVAGSGSPFSPFAKYIGTSAQGIYNMGQAQTVSNALFITDTYFPPMTTTKKTFDLSKDQDQPFLNFNAKCVFNIDDDGTELNKLLMKNLAYPGLACLYDYLDKNQEPISLALPTVEAVPMICGLGVDVEDGMPGIKFKADTFLPDIPYTIKVGDDEHKRHRKITRYTLDNIPDLSVSGVVTFPFKHMMGNRAPKNYQVEVLSAVFFAENDLRARVARAALNPGTWSQPMGQIDDNGVFWQKATANAPQFSNVKTTAGALQQFRANLHYSLIGPTCIFHKITDTEDPPPTDASGNPIFEKLPEFTDVITTDGTGKPFHVLDKDGNVPGWWVSAYEKSGNKLLEKAEDLSARKPNSLGQNDQTSSFTATEDFRPYIAIWARVVIDGKTVDLAPATIDDDKALLPGCDYQGMESEFQKFSGTGSPLLDFKIDKSFKYTLAGFEDVETKNGDDFKLVDWDTLYAFDPRYNFAPEDWFGVQHGNGGDASTSEWLQKTGADGKTGNQLLGTDGRDPDIFMFTSDQEHLQSIGELVFLPWTQEMTGKVNDPFSGNFAGLGRYHGENNFHKRGDDLIKALEGVPNDTTLQFANYRFMWRTYTPVDHGDKWDPIYELTDNGILCNIVSGTGDFRVNPFSPDTRVLMAALKDTPADYFFASDNHNPKEEVLNPTAALEPSDRKSWAFCEGSSIGAELNDDELEDIAAAMRSRFSQWAQDTSSDRFDWTSAFDGNVNLNYTLPDGSKRQFLWYDGQRGDDQKTIFGIPDKFQNPLHGVDRKFLYSFWRECFQNRQQLFLVFVRAEPLTVGGAGEGSLASAQLGARGVALVWRDPQPPARGTRPPRTNLTDQNAFKQMFDNSGPHQTRVLFYHQFE